MHIFIFASEFGKREFRISSQILSSFNLFSVFNSSLFSLRFHCFSSVIVYKSLHIICVTSIFYNHLDVLLFRVMEVFFHKEILYLCSKVLIIEFYRDVALCTILLNLVVL